MKPEQEITSMSEKFPNKPFQQEGAGSEQTIEFSEGIIQENNIKISLIPSKRKRVRKVNVIIEGEFNISNAQLVKENCIKLLQHFDFVSVSLKNIVDLDLSAIQLLQVLRSSPGLVQKTFTIDMELSKEDRSLMQCCGLTSVLAKD